MSLRNELVKICKKVYANKFVAAYDGNLSVRTNTNTILITRSSVCKGEVTGDDILEIDLNGKLIQGEGKISTETKLHLVVYSRRPEVNSVIHCHPIYSTALAVHGEGLTKHVLPEVLLTLGKVPLCSYGTPSTDELTKTLEPYIDYSWAFFLRNHGAVTIGKSLDDAFYKMEKLEHTSQIIFLARMLGGETELSIEKVQELLAISKNTYSIEQDIRNIF
ncbi:MAG: class II aldolase/adducin family protein [Ignavibacteriaceae bacterium]|nr:class II aldolase/adducin family protein [Ignavibacteriaceae bacterium]